MSLRVGNPNLPRNVSGKFWIRILPLPHQSAYPSLQSKQWLKVMTYFSRISMSLSIRSCQGHFWVSLIPGQDSGNSAKSIFRDHFPLWVVSGETRGFPSYLDVFGYELCGKQTNDPSPKYPRPKPYVPWLCYVTWQKEITVVDGITNQLRFRLGDFPGLSMLGPHKWKREMGVSVAKWWDVRKIQVAVAGFENGGCLLAKEYRWPLKGEKREGNGFYPKALKRSIALPMPWF